MVGATSAFCPQAAAALILLLERRLGARSPEPIGTCLSRGIPSISGMCGGGWITKARAVVASLLI